MQNGSIPTKCKIPHLNFSDIFRQSVTKFMVKAAIWTISLFCSLPPLTNVEKEWAKIAPSLCYGLATLHRGRGGFWTQLLEFPYFVTVCLKVLEKKERWGSVHAFSDDLNLLE